MICGSPFCLSSKGVDDARAALCCCAVLRAPYMLDPGGVEIKLAVLQAALDRLVFDMGEIRADVKDLKSHYYATQAEFEPVKADVKELKTDCVTHAEFDPVKRLVYGAVGLVLISFLTAVIALVITRGAP